MWDFSQTAMTFSDPRYSFDGLGPPLPVMQDFIGSSWPNLWTFDETKFTFDSTSVQYTFDGGAVSGGGIATGLDRNTPSTEQSKLSVTATENLRF